MTELLIRVGVVVLSFVLGYVLISRIPPLQHTPLMTMTNAISAMTILGALILFSVEAALPDRVFGGIAIAMAAFNVVGGFVMTDRMVRLFQRKTQSEPPA